MKTYIAAYDNFSWKGTTRCHRVIEAANLAEALRAFDVFADKPSQYKKMLVKIYELTEVYTA